jgi:tetratricopeptide (TPR) repeat protein
MTSTNRLDLETGLQSAIDLYQNNGTADAIRTLTRLARRFPASGRLWGYLGFLYTELNDPSRAARCFRKAIELSPKSERASLGLFFALWRQGKFNEALKEMGRFALAGKVKDYLSLFGGASTARERAESATLSLLDSELREAEEAYLETEAYPRESLIQIHDARTLRELVNA